MLDISQRFSGNSTATSDATDHPHLLYLLATNGYVGGGLLNIPRSAGIALMEDSPFDKLFNREESDVSPSRNELQHAIYQIAELTIQISIVGLILQEVAVNVIYQNCEVFSYMLLEIKLLYQQGTNTG